MHLTGCSATGITACHFVERRALCARVHFAGSASSRITGDYGNLMMPGFTAPKLLWVQRHEPEIFRQIDKVLLPKDYLRLRMTGEFASDMSDAAGTMWLDVAKRDWSDDMLQACHLSRDQMPALYEGSELLVLCYLKLRKRGVWRGASCRRRW
ncbi:xylulose kinase [Escherichia coli]|uniref:Xylulose kinase n=1 Tax=Escherichia coli TaxID=562 RepID=A0A376ML13_ECOLX|nr:xylulose kinase [Escherichia coli]